MNEGNGKKERFEPRFAATAIGSLPHTNVDAACRLLLENFPEIPVWPQLVKLTFLENMYVQYSEGLPGILVDDVGQRIWFETGGRLNFELESFYQAIIDEDAEHFAVSEEYAHGLHAFLSGKYSAELSGCQFIKGQVTGPVSFGLTVMDQNGKAPLYDETLEEVIVKGLTLKARWQTRGLKDCAPGARVIMFIDEPYLVSVGSALLSVSREQVVNDIRDVAMGCEADLVGVHCCGNTDWSMVFETGVDIVNFDAYSYLEGFVAYHEQIAEHVGRGGAIAWGLVPNSETALKSLPEELAGLVERAFDTLEKRGIDRGLLASQSMVMPACGLGPVSKAAADRAIPLTREVSELLRERYF